MNEQKRTSTKSVNGRGAAAAKAVASAPIVSNFKGFLEEAEALIRATSDFSTETVANARAQFQKKIDQAKQAVSDVEQMAKDSYDKSLELSEQYVKENPWQIVAAAVALGFILGKLSGRAKT